MQDNTSDLERIESLLADARRQLAELRLRKLEAEAVVVLGADLGSVLKRLRNLKRFVQVGGRRG